MMRRGILPPALIRRYQEGGEVEEEVSAEDEPYVGMIDQSFYTMNPYMRSMLFGTPGTDDQPGTPGYLEGAFAATERAFFDDEGKPLVVPHEIAALTPDQALAFDLTRRNVGVQQPFLEQARDAYASGIGALDYGLDQQLLQGQRGMSTLKGAAGYEEAQRMLGLQDALGGIGDARGYATSAEAGLRGSLDEAGDLLRDTTGSFDQSMTQDFYDPYEQRVVDQTVDDAMRGLARTDQQAIAQAIGAGGESAFGSRAGLSAADRAEAVGRGLAQEVGNIRSRGYQQAQGAAMGEFERQQAAKRAAATGLSGMASQQYGATSGLGQTMLGLGQAGQSARTGAGQAGMGTAGTLAAGYGKLGNIYGSAGGQRLGAQQGYGGFMQGLGGQMQAANQADIAALSGIGALQQSHQQNIYDAQRGMLQQAQMAPLLQYQSLMPFVNMAGEYARPGQTGIRYTAPPNPLSAGLSTGLSAFGAFGNMFNPFGFGQQQNNQQQNNQQQT